MTAALGECIILGIHTTVGFHRDVIDHPEFRAGRATTSFIGKYFPSWRTGEADDEGKTLALAAAAFDALTTRSEPGGRAGREGWKDAPNPWMTMGRWRAGEGL
jgi:geranyl-CoA carboxylase alpha subunit